MIPKKIHYCWFGGNPLPEDYIKNISTWREKMPDYEIIEWNETNYDVNKNDFIKSAYKEKKWAFVSDYARLDIVYTHGGIYLDTDVEVIKSFDDLLENDAFMGVEMGQSVSTGLGFGAVKGHLGILENMKAYESMSFYDESGNINLIPCPKITTSLLIEKGLGKLDKVTEVMGITIYPDEYFCPMNYFTGKVTITPNTYSIHKYSMSWTDKTEKKRFLLERKLTKIFNRRIAGALSKIIFAPVKVKNRIKELGFKKATKFYWEKLRKSK